MNFEAVMTRKARQGRDRLCLAAVPITVSKVATGVATSSIMWCRKRSKARAVFSPPNSRYIGQKRFVELGRHTDLRNRNDAIPSCDATSASVTPFAKLINDMRNIKMTMSRMQLNSKFVNNMLPEWGRFVTIMKLNRGLRDSNYDQLYAYLKQHEAHANENKMMLERFTQHTVDPLALMSNVSYQQYFSQSSTTLPSTNDRQNKGQRNNARGTSAASYGGAQNSVGNVNPGQARQIKCYNCNGGQDNVDDDVDEQLVQDLALNVDNVFQANECDAFDSDVDVLLLHRPCSWQIYHL
nr:hypothetical protein [Tanacetum cinerariifolium]